MIIDCISDLHGYYPVLESGDLLILAGDITARDSIKEWYEFFNWLDKQDYKKKILIGGNHDNFLTNCCSTAESKDIYPSEECEKHEYLCDSGTEFEGLKIWGSPYSVWFRGVNPHCSAFMLPESALEEKFKQIPHDVDILVTHTPPYLILDSNCYGEACGSLMLRRELDTRLRPKLHVFGHIHEGYGELLFKHEGSYTICANASHVNEHYKPINKPVRVIL